MEMSPSQLGQAQDAMVEMSSSVMKEVVVLEVVGEVLEVRVEVRAIGIPYEVEDQDGSTPHAKRM
jgi:hypothetical protein